MAKKPQLLRRTPQEIADRQARRAAVETRSSAPEFERRPTAGPVLVKEALSSPCSNTRAHDEKTCPYCTGKPAALSLAAARKIANALRRD